MIAESEMPTGMFSMFSLWYLAGDDDHNSDFGNMHQSFNCNVQHVQCRPGIAFLRVDVTDLADPVISYTDRSIIGCLTKFHV